MLADAEIIAVTTKPSRPSTSPISYQHQQPQDPLGLHRRRRRPPALKYPPSAPSINGIKSAATALPGNLRNWSYRPTSSTASSTSSRTLFAGTLRRIPRSGQQTVADVEEGPRRHRRDGNPPRRFLERLRVPAKFLVSISHMARGPRTTTTGPSSRPPSRSRHRARYRWRPLRPSHHAPWAARTSRPSAPHRPRAHHHHHGGPRRRERRLRLASHGGRIYAAHVAAAAAVAAEIRAAGLRANFTSRRRRTRQAVYVRRRQKGSR